MITYITDSSGKTHSYSNDEYMVTANRETIKVMKISEGKQYPYRTVAEFYNPVGWWESNPMARNQSLFCGKPIGGSGGFDL